MVNGQVDDCCATPPATGCWEEAKRSHYSCSFLTSILREQVPVLDFVKWEVNAIEQGLAHTILPLIASSTNQHCTHQAALFFLAADYTGGIALASLIFDWPVVGVHPVASSDKSMALWLVKGEIKYLRPSVGRLDVIAKVDPERHDRVRRRFGQGRPVLESIIVRFCNGGTEVAEATMTYYARQSDKLRTDGVSPERVNILYQHKLISSAELIAGVRARENGTLFEDPYASRIAGEHGLALANRFCEKSPQLGGMVAARTRHMDRQIMDFVRKGGRDLVIVGTGYDMRPFRLELPAGTRVFELDFPTVLIDRQRRLDEFSVRDPAGVRRVPVPVDLRAATVSAVLKGLVDPMGPVFVAWEGMSMYFREPEVRTILRGIAPVLGNPRSRLWADFVTEQAIVNSGIFPEVEAFMHGMQLLGEPFVFGTDSLEAFMESNGFGCVEIAPSSLFLAGEVDPVYSIYSFCVASAAIAPAKPAESRDRDLRTVPPPHIPSQFAGSLAETPVAGKASADALGAGFIDSQESDVVADYG